MSDEIKVGDKVRVREDAPKIFFNRSVCCYPDYIFEVREVEDGNADIYFGSGKISIAAFVLPLKYLVKVEEEPKEPTKNPNVGKITIPVKADLTDSYWDAYVADLAKEIALKVANEFNDPKETAEYAVLIAKAVVEGLKRK